MTTDPADALSFSIICPEAEDMVDIEFSGTTLISNLISHLKTLLHLTGTDYYLSDGHQLDCRRSLKDVLRDGASYLLLNSKDSQSVLDKNLQLALKNHSEGFTIPKRILIDVNLNGHRMKGFLDSGAARSVLSPEAVAKCGLQQMVDPRFRDEAAGVGGNQNAVGKVHHCQLATAGRPKPISFHVLQGADALFNKEEVLLGIDFMHKYVKSIDFEENWIL